MESFDQSLKHLLHHNAVDFIRFGLAEPEDPLLEEQTLQFGAKGLTHGSRCVYVKVNLRALAADELLATAPPALWPLVALTRDGATVLGVRKARAAIGERTSLAPAMRADHLAVLWFVAEAEGVAVQAMKVYISEESLMESELYKSIFEKGEAKGETRGRAEGRAQGRAEASAENLVRFLVHRLGIIDPVLRKRIRSVSDADLLESIFEQALLAPDEAALRLVIEKSAQLLPA